MEVAENPWENIEQKYRDFVDRIGSSVPELLQILELTECLRYSNIKRMLPADTIEGPEFIILLCGNSRFYTQKLSVYQLCDHVASLFDARKTLALDMEKISEEIRKENGIDGLRELQSDVVDFCINAKGILIISDSDSKVFNPGIVIDAINSSNSSSNDDKLKTPVMMLTIIGRNNYSGYLRFRYSTVNSIVNHLFISDSNSQYMLPVITQAVDDFLHNNDNYNKHGLLISQSNGSNYSAFNHPYFKITTIDSLRSS